MKRFLFCYKDKKMNSFKDLIYYDRLDKAILTAMQKSDYGNFDVFLIKFDSFLKSDKTLNSINYEVLPNNCYKIHSFIDNQFIKKIEI